MKLAIETFQQSWDKPIRYRLVDLDEKRVLCRRDITYRDVIAGPRDWFDRVNGLIAESQRLVAEEGPTNRSTALFCEAMELVFGADAIPYLPIVQGEAG